MTVQKKNEDESSMLRLITLATLGVSVLTVVFIARGPGNLAASVTQTCSTEFAKCMKTEDAKAYCKVCAKGGGSADTAASCTGCTAGKKKCQAIAEACNGKK